MKSTIIALLFFTATACSAFGMSPEQVHALIKRVDANSAPIQYESYLSIKNHKPGGSFTEQKAHVYRKDDKVLIVITSPAIQKGQAIIRNADDMWMYLPNSGKVLRIGAKEQSMGGEASNTDLLRVDLAEDYTGTYVGEETVDGTLCYKLELKANDRTIAYDKVIYWISKEKELPVKREYYSLSGKHLKTMYLKDVKNFHGRVRPSFLLILNEQNTQYKTEILVEEMVAVNNLGDFIFTPSYARRGTLQ
ncbi:MAG: outer membrane lipoprotein-sorting protein [Spirochaetales bacterium]|nr:outer membrane lipoprotein-sorting protein [Spirochaetales bacterium]